MSEITGFRLSRKDFTPVGSGLGRPECVVAEPDGTLWISDNRGALTRIGADGSQRLIGEQNGVPNGFALAADGTFLVADIEGGTVFRVDRDGNRSAVLDEFEGDRIGAVNYVYLDHAERMWVPVSTRVLPRFDALETPTPDGFVLLVDGSGVRKVADGLHFTNEVRLHQGHLYVVETTAGCVTRFAADEDGTLSGRETYGPAPIFPGAMIDGIAFDAEGNLWLTEITRNGLHVITPDGGLVTLFEDPQGTDLHVPTSVAFAGEDLRTGYVGSLKMDHIVRFTSPVPGAPMQHLRRLGTGTR
jgi:gluconolactonase